MEWIGLGVLAVAVGAALAAAWWVDRCEADRRAKQIEQEAIRDFWQGLAERQAKRNVSVAAEERRRTAEDAEGRREKRESEKKQEKSSLPFSAISAVKKGLTAEDAEKVSPNGRKKAALGD